jgi:hypothetical protein
MTASLFTPHPRRTPVNTARTSYVLGAALAVASVLFLLLGIGALGIVGDGDRDAIYLVVPAVLVLGALVARFRAHAMAAALTATAATTLAVALVACLLVVRNDESASLLDIVMVSGLYAALFATSAWLFHRSDRLA